MCLAKSRPGIRQGVPAYQFLDFLEPSDVFVFRKRLDTPAEFADYYAEDSSVPQRRRPESPPRAGVRWHLHLICLGVLLAMCLLLVRLVAGQPMFEKSIKALLAPVGIVWMLLFLIAWFSLLCRRGAAAFLSVTAWLVLTIGGNSMTVDLLSRSLQFDYELFRIDNAPTVSVLLVLGGGTSTTPMGMAQGDRAGDRVLVAAQMAIATKADTIVCSGTSGLGLIEGELTAGEGTKQLLTGLGVPAERIETIAGRNTREEFEEFAQWLVRNQHQSDSIGIVTSAWHMKRAMRLARGAGIEAIAVPADFAGGNPRATPHLLIPGAGNLQACEAFLFEYLSVLIGR